MPSDQRNRKSDQYLWIKQIGVGVAIVLIAALVVSMVSHVTTAETIYEKKSEVKKIKDDINGKLDKILEGIGVLRTSSEVNASQIEDIKASIHQHAEINQETTKEIKRRLEKIEDKVK